MWDNFGGLPMTRMFWDIAAAIEPRTAERRDAVTIRPMTQAGELHQAFSRIGFRDVTETMLPMRMDFANFDDYWTPMRFGQGTHAEFLASLPELSQHKIEAAVRAAYLCNRPDGPRGFAGVAWAARGVAPAA